MKKLLSVGISLWSFCAFIAVAAPSGWVIGWGSNPAYGCDGVPLNQSSTNLVTIDGKILNDAAAVSAGIYHSLALKSNGTVVGWGIDLAGQATGYVPKGTDHTNGPVVIAGRPLDNVVAISAEWSHSLALKRDGTVIEWGAPLPGKTFELSSLSNITAIAAGNEHNLALKRDGTVIGWGRVKMPIGLSNIVSIAAAKTFGGNDTAIKSDGTVIQWNTRSGQVRNVAGLSSVVAVAIGQLPFGGDSYVALKRDGTVVGWGGSDVPVGLTNAVTIAAGGTYDLALRKDGTVFAWGRIVGIGSATVPAGLSNVVAIAAGNNYCLAITTNRSVAEKFMQK
jgi:alpha-tubulin suppressor-like RCC1 family protein